MQHLEVRGAVRPLKWSLGVKWLSMTNVKHNVAMLLTGDTRRLQIQGQGQRNSQNH